MLRGRRNGRGEAIIAAAANGRPAGRSSAARFPQTRYHRERRSAPRCPPPTEFWQLLVRSRLVEPPACAALHAEFDAALPPGRAGDGSAKAIAAWLVGRRRSHPLAGAATRRGRRRTVLPRRLPAARAARPRRRRAPVSARHEPSGRTVALLLLSAKRCRELDVWTDIVRRTTAANRAADPMLSRTWSLEQHDGRRFIVCEDVAGAPWPTRSSGSGRCLRSRPGCCVADRPGGRRGARPRRRARRPLARRAPPRGPRRRRRRTGRVRLLQFPLATDPHVVPLRPAVATEAEVASLGRAAAFVAPELLVPGAECDPRSDVYAIGAIFHALLAGRPPRWNGDPRATLAKASFSGPDLLPPQVPAEIAAVVGDFWPAIRRGATRRPAKRPTRSRPASVSRCRRQRSPRLPSRQRPARCRRPCRSAAPNPGQSSEQATCRASIRLAPPGRDHPPCEHPWPGGGRCG